MHQPVSSFFALAAALAISLSANHALADELVAGTRGVGSSVPASTGAPTVDVPPNAPSDAAYGKRGRDALHLEVNTGFSSYVVHAGAALTYRVKYFESGLAVDATPALFSDSLYSGSALVGVVLPDGVRRYHLLADIGAHQETLRSGDLFDIDLGTSAFIAHAGMRAGVDWGWGGKTFQGTFGLSLFARAPLQRFDRQHTYVNTNLDLGEGSASANLATTTAEFGRRIDFGLSVSGGFDFVTSK